MTRALVYTVLIALCTAVGLAGHFYGARKEETYREAIALVCSGQESQATDMFEALDAYKYAPQALAYCRARAGFVETEAATYAPTLTLLGEVGENYGGELREEVEAFRARVTSLNDLYQIFREKEAPEEAILPHEGMREQSLLLPPFSMPDGIVRRLDGQSTLYRWYAPCAGAWMCTAEVKDGIVTEVKVYMVE